MSESAELAPVVSGLTTNVNASVPTALAKAGSRLDTGSALTVAVTTPVVANAMALTESAPTVPPTTTASLPKPLIPADP